MKKEYHYTIARTDRICLVSFVILLLGWELIKGLFPGGDKSYAYAVKEKTFSENKWEKPARKKYTAKRYSMSYSDERKENQYDHPHQKMSPTPEPLEIMTATVNQLTSMGFSIKTAFNIRKYVASGGVITSPKDLMRIYGMDSLQFKNASPYIVYAPAASKKEFVKYGATDKTPLKPILDLNTSTITELELLNGIGTKLAERVVKFRESLGGFNSVDQLKDCYGISPELFDALKSQLIVTGEIKRIEINSKDLATVVHPYLNKKMIKLITAYREQHGSILNEEMLRKVYPADSSWFDQIIPYLDFSED